MSKQEVISHSSMEAETVALDKGLRTEGLPLQTLFDTVKLLLTHPNPLPDNHPRKTPRPKLLPRDTPSTQRTLHLLAPDVSKLVIAEDNESAIRVMQTGCNRKN